MRRAILDLLLNLPSPHNSSKPRNAVGAGDVAARDDEGLHGFDEEAGNECRGIELEKLTGPSERSGTFVEQPIHPPIKPKKKRPPNAKSAKQTKADPIFKDSE
jgi:hypothetical protein